MYRHRLFVEKKEQLFAFILKKVPILEYFITMCKKSYKVLNRKKAGRTVLRQHTAARTPNLKK